MSNHDLNFDAVIPSHLLLNKKINPMARLFYAVIRNLSNKFGYCFASNIYLSEMMGVNERTIRRWLKNLSNEGYIEVELEGLSDRKIYLSDEFKESLRRTSLSKTPDKNARHNEDSGKEIGRGIEKASPSLPFKKEEYELLKSYDMGMDEGALRFLSSKYHLEKIKEARGKFLRLSQQRKVRNPAGLFRDILTGKITGIIGTRGEENREWAENELRKNNFPFILIKEKFVTNVNYDLDISFEMDQNDFKQAFKNLTEI
jgi:DNA-binding PadR family transcriptional regulator